MLSQERRYQIFVSSTFNDLKEERAIVTEAILEMNQMPYGMEVFPAANESQWEWIKRTIEESDYYIVIVGGKYGSINKKTGISYTEMEYRYAEEVGVPTIAFLVDESVDLPKSKIETDSAKAKKLKAFREYIESQKMRKSYTTKDDLKAKVITSLISLINRIPGEGWIRTKSLKNYTSNDEVIRLMRENEELKSRLYNEYNLIDGEDTISVNYTLTTINDRKGKLLVEERQTEITIEELFLLYSSFLYENVCEYSDFKEITETYILNGLIAEDIPKGFTQKDLAMIIPNEELDKIIIQLEAIDYITISRTHTWKLTEKGRKKYILSKAIKKQ